MNTSPEAAPRAAVAAPEARTAVVVFSGRAALWWMRFFKPGFRHCFVCVETGGGPDAGWAVIDPLSHRTQVGWAAPLPPGALAAWFAERGMRAVVTQLRAPPRTRAPAAPYTCVEAVKRVLGLRARSVFTPWRLYRALTR